MAVFNKGTGGAIPVVAPKGTGGGSGVTGVGAIIKMGSNEHALIFLQRR